jgi:2-dehydropantoate 2-reductase
MRILVVGAGAVGGYYAAKLALAGQSVSLLVRDTQLQRLQDEGLTLHQQGQVWTVRPPVSADVAVAAQADVVLVCVKSAATESVAKSFAAHLRAHALVVSLQNGVGNPARLEGVLPQRVAAAAVYLASACPRVGEVHHHGRGELLLGPGPRWAKQGHEGDAQGPGELHTLAEVLRASGVPTELSPQLMPALWHKLVVNCAYNAVCALSGLPYGELVKLPEVVQLQRAVVREVLAVAQAEGYPLSEAQAWADTERIAQSMPTQHSSTAQDLQRARPSEIDDINGAVVRAGRQHGLPTPANQALWAAVQALQTQRTQAANPSSPTLRL